MQDFNLKAIAHIHSPFFEKFGTPRQAALVPAAQAHIEFLPGTQASQWLEGLTGFSHLWLISVFHQHLNQPSPNKVHPPRLGGESVGVLASRSPHRPNPIGLSLVEIVFCQGRDLLVKGVDLLHGTPILDIKPYVLECDQPQTPVKSGWVGENPWTPYQVEFLPQVSVDLQRIYQLHPPPISAPALLQLAGEVLRQDPRAVPDRNSPRRFWLRLYEVDFGFRIYGQKVCVEQVRFAYSSPLFARFETIQSDRQKQP